VLVNCTVGLQYNKNENGEKNGRRLYVNKAWQTNEKLQTSNNYCRTLFVTPPDEPKRMDSDDSDSDNIHPLEMLDAPDEEESSSDEDDEEQRFVILQSIKENDPDTTVLSGDGSYERIQIITDEEWEELGQDIANNSYLEKLFLNEGAFNDHKMSFFFRGLTRSSTIKYVQLYRNGLSIAGVRSMVPFLHSSNSLRKLDLDNNNIQSEGFNMLFRALRDSPIERLNCSNCGIESIDIDSDHTPRALRCLDLDGNNINTDGCRGLATLLQVDSTLTILWLDNNEIDDEGVEILANALQTNTSLKTFYLKENAGISSQGQIMLLKLVNNISCIQATLQSNHTLRDIFVEVADDEMQMNIDMATRINKSYESNPEAAGREKIIQSQLHSETRAELAALQGIGHSVFSEIDPLHLPEVLSLIDEWHGQGELFDALKTSIIRLFSTVNMKECIQQQRDYHAAMVAELDAKLVTMEESDRNVTQNMETQSSKRRRV
jgi:hypothetical protein